MGLKKILSIMKHLLFSLATWKKLRHHGQQHIYISAVLLVISSINLLVHTLLLTFLATYFDQTEHI